MVSGMTIAIKEAVFMAAQTSLTNSINTFTPESGPVPDITSQAVTLEHFRAQFEELGKVLSLYQELLTRDGDIIQRAHDNLVGTDRTLAAWTER